MLLCGEARADELHCRESALFQIENDNSLFAFGIQHTDELYTNGWSAAVTACGAPPDWLEALAAKLPIFGRAPAGPPSPVPVPEYVPHAVDVGIDLGQTIYTPKDLQLDPPRADDRPYAALAWFGAWARLRTARETVLLQLDLGIIGEDAGGKEFQDAVHTAFGFKHARGWGHQLPNEGGLQGLARWERRLMPAPPPVVDGRFHARWAIYGHGVATAGSFRGHVGAGATLRGGIGFERVLPDELPVIAYGLNVDGTPRKPPWWTHWGLSVFLRGEARAVGWNATIEGPIFTAADGTHGARVFVWDAEAGATLSITRYVLVQWGWVLRGPEMRVAGEGTHQFREIQIGVAWSD